MPKKLTPPFVFSMLVLLACFCSTVQASADRDTVGQDPVIEQLLKVQSVGGAVISPDGSRAAYTVSRNLAAKDKRVTNIWLVDLDTRESRQLTHMEEGEAAVAWHPQEDAITFLSDRHDTDKGESQLWLLPLSGGEARRITDIDSGIEDYVYSGDGKHIAAVVTDPDPFKAPEPDAEISTAPPIVIERFAFKADRAGYLTRSQKIYLLDGETGEGEALALAGQEPGKPSFSPDGKYLAYVAKGAEEPDRTEHYDVYLLPLNSKKKARALAPSPLNDCGDWLIERPVWNKASSHIACLSSDSDGDNFYAQPDLTLLEVATGKASNLTADLDLNIAEPHFGENGERLFFTIEDDMTVQLASMPSGGGEIRREFSEPMTVSAFDISADGLTVALIGKIEQPEELYTLAAGKATQLSRHNDALIAQRPWQPAQPINFKSPDGTEIHGLLMRPEGAKKGRRYPTVLWIHGGPTSQFGYEPRLEPQLFAAHGYAVVMVNPRGSTGRGLAFSKEIWGGWGSVDVPDVLAGVDHVVAMGVADPKRLVVGGWSYGGMLTNYVIASDQRFKAAASGASIGNAWAGFGTDQYIRDYLSELGAPWDNPEGYNRVSYPFMHADRITTPTLFMVGEVDYNVPLLATEQMYQALQVLRVPSKW